jgi:predicted metal-binding protein
MPEIFSRKIEEALNGRAHETAVMDTAALAFVPALRKACEDNICGNYDKCWTCPPAVGSMDEMAAKIRSYERAFVFTTKLDLEDSFDFEGMVKAKEIHDRLTREIHDRFGKEHPVYGAGGCTFCEKCAYPEPCRFKEKAFPSIEAAGINVTDLSRSAGVTYNNGPNTVTYFSMVLFNG